MRPDPLTPKTQATTFLRALFGRKFPEGALAALWSGKSKQSSYLKEPGEASRYAGEPDVYVAACLTAKSVGRNKRPTMNDAAAIPGVWADLDVEGGPDQPAGKRPAKDREAALEVARAILPPTIVVDSGYGLQAWWLFEDVATLPEKEQRDQAVRVSLGWQVLLRREANGRGFTIDSTHDLARLMRLPGTYNDKGPPKQRADVVVLEGDGPRHTFEGIAEIAMENAPRLATGGAAIDVKLGEAFPQLKHQAMLDNDERYRQTWDHTRRDRESGGWSTSEYDMALASMAVKQNWTDGEIAVLIVAHRKRHNGPHDAKAGRVDYISRTISRAKADERRGERERIREEALHELAQQGEESNGAPDPKKAMELFNIVISAADPRAPRFKELIQYSTDPDTARYVLVMEDGTEINVGDYDNLRQPRRLDRRIGPVTGWVMDTVKDNDVWRDGVRTLMAARTIREEEDEPILEWVARYTEDRLGAKREVAAKEGEPFEEGEYVYIKPSALARFAKKVLAENIRSADVVVLLRKAGFEQKTVHHPGRSGKPSTASYWRIDREELE